MKYFFVSIFFIVFITLIVVYFNISKVSVKPETQKIEIKSPLKEEISIVKLLADTKTKAIFPAKELYLKVDLNYIPKTKILYQTIINNLDKYKLFGIEQILELNKIRYSIIKSQNDLKLFINFNKKSDATKIQRLFENYNFDVKLKKVTIKG